MSETSDDLSALAWVYEEVRRSLETAHKGLRRFVKESEASANSDVDAVDPSVLRGARMNIHQSVGALELVGLGPLAAVLSASEAAVALFIAKPHKLNAKAVEDIERASFALLDYIGRVLGGKTVSPLSLFPQYRAVQEDVGADRVHPADLWGVAWRWLDLPADGTVQPRPPNAATRAGIEKELLALIRAAEPRAAARRLSDAFAGIAKAARHSKIIICWKLAAAVFEAQAHGLLGFDVYSKRLGSRLLAQFRSLARGEIDVSERLALDLLFFCEQSRTATGATPRLAAVQKTYGLASGEPVDYTTSHLGRYDPAWVAQARKRVTAAKETWSAVAGGEMHRLSGLSEQFSLVGDSLKRLFPLGEVLAKVLHDAAGVALDSGAAPPAPLAMEAATCLLYVEAVLEDADFDHPQQPQRVQRLAQRLNAVRQGKAPEPLESWMEELYRRVSDKQTMGSVVQELRASLSEAEKLIDQFFRDTGDPKPLIDVPKYLSAMRGVLSVLGMDHASAALAKMRDEVDGLATTQADLPHAAQAGVFDRLAGNLGALGFLIDMLSVQPQMAKSLFTYDAADGSLKPIMGRGVDRSALSVHAAQAGSALEQQLIDQARQLARDASQKEVSSADLVLSLERLSRGASAADRSGLAQATRDAQQALVRAVGGAGISAARDQVSKTMTEFLSPGSSVRTLERGVAHKPAAPTATPAPKAISEAVQDDELREVFLEEAREVIGDATAALAELNETPGELPILTTIRRAFHTLKGSSRMVGLKDFGEAAWTCEKLYNTSLAEQREADRDLLQFTAWALEYLASWVEEIAARRAHEHSSAVVAQRALTHAEAGEARDSRRDGLSSSSPAKKAAISVPGPLAAQAAPAAFTPSLPAVQPVPPTLEFSFSLDLPPSDDSLPSTGSALRAESAQAEVQALFDPFDLNVTDTLPLPQTIEAAAADIAIDLIDLDLGQEFSAATPAKPSDPVRVMVAAEPHAPDLVPEPIELPELRELSATAAAALDAPPSVPIPLPEVVQDDASEEEETDAELVKVIGPLRISIALFNIYLNEADELSRRLTTELAEWAMELHRPIGEIPIALAHSLAGSSATVGFANLSNLARTLEHALTRSQAIGRGTPQEARLFVDAAEEIRRLLHQFAAGFLKDPSVTLLSRLDEHELSSARWLEAVTAAADMLPPSRSGALGGSAAPGTPAAAAMPEAFAVTPPPAPAAITPETTPKASPASDVRRLASAA
ncbi:MAG: Hpt domain-containing protein, partial [Burkholderiaceae bacterium]